MAIENVFNVKSFKLFWIYVKIREEVCNNTVGKTCAKTDNL
jgi:hypothetical protein